MDVLCTPALIKRLVYLSLVIGITCLVEWYVANPQGFWLIGIALTLSLETKGNSFKRRLLTMVIAGLVVVAAVFVAGYLAGSFFLAASYLFVVTMTSVFVSQRYPSFFLVAFIINMFTILSIHIPVSPVENMNRLMLMILGVTIVSIFQFLFYPYFIRNELRTFIFITMKNLKRLNHEIFSCLLLPEYSDNIYLFEKRLHVQKNRFMRSLMRLREIVQLVEIKMNVHEKEVYLTLLTKLDLLYSNMLDYSQIRRRVSDHTTFSVCSDELGEIAKEIDKSIDGMIAHMAKKQYYINAKMLAIKIKLLDDNYQNVLQIAAREPLVFMLFIDSLNAFNQRIEEFYEITLPLSNNFS